MRLPCHNDVKTFQKIIDEISIEETLNLLAIISADKAQQLRAIHPDSIPASRWDYLGSVLSSMADHYFVQSISQEKNV